MGGFFGVWRSCSGTRGTAERCASSVNGVRSHHGVTCAVAWVHVDNHPSAELFRRLGFSVVPTEPGEDGAEHRYERDIGSG